MDEEGGLDDEHSPSVDEAVKEHSGDGSIRRCTCNVVCDGNF